MFVDGFRSKDWLDLILALMLSASGLVFGSNGNYF